MVLRKDGGKLSRDFPCDRTCHVEFEKRKTELKIGKVPTLGMMASSSNEQDLNGPENASIRKRPRLADALIGVDFDSMPMIDIYGKRFLERAEAMDKLSGGVEKNLYDWKWSSIVNRKEAEGREGEQVPAKLVDVTEPEIVCLDSSPSPPPKQVRHKRHSKETKQLLREIERIRAEALADIEPFPETVMDDDVLDEEVFAKIEQEYEYNRTMNVRISDYKGNMKKYTMLVRESFVKIFNDLAQEHNIERNQVMLTFKEIFIKVYDTPKSIGLRIGDCIDFCKLHEPVNIPLTERDKTHMITLKLQCATSRKRIELSTYKVDRLSKLMKEFCKVTGKDLAKLLFKFDDEDISPDSTPVDLELENGYCIDVIEAK